ncbi:GIY-YIG nuclease family protein [Candidatus Uhrbacteria bacterium]|nr:GIY-YIG nuclease family protein [Candidatus Uhrbacteria bacterium]
MEVTPALLAPVPHQPGVYVFTRQGVPLYVGKAADLRGRLAAYAPGNSWKTDMLQEADGFRVHTTDSELEALLLEVNWIKVYRPKYNIVDRDQKSLLYIGITDEEYPQVLPTRIFAASGTYIGPFVSAYVVRQTLRALRKVFPYRCARMPIAESHKPQARPCLYFHMGLCAGTCAGRITPEQYRRRVITPLIRLLEGKTTSARRALDPTHRALLDEVLAHTRVLSVTEKYANDVHELQRVLGLPRPPHRIEGYDISNTQGIEAVGSMVVAIDGEPALSEYRKFKIRSLEGKSNDIGMLTEVLTRRLAHSATKKQQGEDEAEREEWPMPDLLLIDGGKAQRNAALRVVRRSGLVIPVVSLAKREEEIYLPGASGPLRLSRHAPALHLLQRIRDEAHRFAIGYHRKRRTKRMLQ